MDSGKYKDSIRPTNHREKILFFYKEKGIEFISRPINEDRMNGVFCESKPQMIGIVSN